MKKTLGTTLSLWMLSGIALGEISQQEFEERRQKATKVLFTVDQVETHLKQYEEARNHFYTPMMSYSKAYFNGVDRWTSNWREIITTVEFGSSYDAYLKALQNTFEKQSVHLQELRDLSERVRRMKVKVLEALPPTISRYSHLTRSQQEVVKQLNQRIQELRSSAETVDTKTMDYLGDMTLINDISSQALIIKIKQELIDNGQYPVASSLKRYSEMVAFESTARPIINDLEALSFKMSDNSLDFAYFQAKSVHDRSISLCRKAQDAIRSSSLTPDYKSKAAARIEGLCQSIATNWNTFAASGLSQPEMVYEYSFLKFYEYQEACRSSSTDVDCERLKDFENISQEALNSYSQDQLKQYEETWNQLKFENQ